MLKKTVPKALIQSSTAHPYSPAYTTPIPSSPYPTSPYPKDDYASPHSPFPSPHYGSSTVAPLLYDVPEAVYGGAPYGKSEAYPYYDYGGPHDIYARSTETKDHKSQVCYFIVVYIFRYAHAVSLHFRVMIY